MKEYVEEFKVEAASLVENLVSSLMFFESNLKQRDIVEEIFRGMHTLKGSARMFGFESIEQLTHQLENIFNDIRSSNEDVNPEVVSLSLEVTDEISAILKGGKTPKYAQLINRIHHISPFITKDKNLTTYCVFFNPANDIFLRGINPQSALEELEELASLKVFTYGDAISLEEQEKQKEFVSRFALLLATETDLEEVEDVFMFFREEEFTIIELHDIDEEFKGQLQLFANQEIQDDHWVEMQDFLNQFTQEETSQEKEQVEEDVIPVKEEIHKPEVQKEKLNYINVNLNKLDEMLYLLSDLVTVKAELTYSAEQLKDPQLLSSVEKLEKITNRFRDNAFSVRLVPIQVLSVKFQRLIRDMGLSFGKEINFITEGMDTEIDKAIINEVEAPLMHIIRNALDHGIESKEERITKNKDEKGLLKMVAFYSGAHVFIQIQDDGRGLDLERIRQKAIQKGWANSDEALTEKEIIDFIFRPGFTTEEQVTEYSGRGVGMDVVRECVRAMRGNVEVTTEKDLGTSFTIRLPLSLSILDVMHIAHRGTQYLIPKNEILQCVSEVYHQDTISRVGHNLKMNDELIPLVSLDELKDRQEKVHQELRSIIIIDKNDQKVAIEVEEIVGEDQVVVKPIDDALKSIKYLGGISVMGNGDLAFVLDALKLRDSFAI